MVDLPYSRRLFLLGWAYSDGVDKVTGVSANDSLLAQQEHGGDHSH